MNLLTDWPDACARARMSSLVSGEVRMLMNVVFAIFKQNTPTEGACYFLSLPANSPLGRAMLLSKIGLGVRTSVPNHGGVSTKARPPLFRFW